MSPTGAVQSRFGWVVATMLCLGLIAFSIAKAAEDENVVKAALIYNFISFVEWPEQAKPANTDAMVCVVGENDPVMSYLEQISERSPQPIEVSEKGRDSRINECHILYISANNKSDIDYMIGKSQGESILTVSDAKDFVKRGGAVGFVMQDGQVKLETNITTTNKAKLVIDSELLELMKIYR